MRCLGGIVLVLFVELTGRERENKRERYVGVRRCNDDLLLRIEEFLSDPEVTRAWHLSGPVHKYCNSPLNNNFMCHTLREDISYW